MGYVNDDDYNVDLPSNYIPRGHEVMDWTKALGPDISPIRRGLTDMPQITGVKNKFIVLHDAQEYEFEEAMRVAKQQAQAYGIAGVYQIAAVIEPEMKVSVRMFDKRLEQRLLPRSDEVAEHQAPTFQVTDEERKVIEEMRKNLSGSVLSVVEDVSQDPADRQ